jgi:hypothetical protein
MADFKWFEHRLTGKVGYYPENFADLFADTFVEVPSEDVDCVDCGKGPVEDENWGYPDEFVSAQDELKVDEDVPLNVAYPSVAFHDSTPDPED